MTAKVENSKTQVRHNTTPKPKVKQTKQEIGSDKNCVTKDEPKVTRNLSATSSIFETLSKDVDKNKPLALSAINNEGIQILSKLSEIEVLNNQYSMEDGSIDKLANTDEDMYSTITSAPSAILGFFAGIIGNISNNCFEKSKDGKIGTSMQGSTGNCWALSGVNALSYTKAGQEIIKNSLEYKEDGTLVHLDGAGDYFVSNKALTQAKGSLFYSKGDDDVKIFELAIEQALNDIANGNLILSENSPSYLENSNEVQASKGGKSSATGGFTAEAIYYITGKTSESYSKDNMTEALDKAAADGGQNIVLSGGVINKVTTTDVNGKKVTLVGPHAYAVKEVKDGIVTVINPWNSGKEIKLDYSTFTNSFDQLYLTDLSDNNQKQNLTEKGYPETIKNDDGASSKIVKNKDGATIYETKFDKNGHKISNTEYLANGNKKRHSEFYSNGKKSQEINYTYSSDSTETTMFTYDKKGKTTSRDKTVCDKNNTVTQHDYSSYDNGKETQWVLENYDENGSLRNKQVTDYNTDGSIIITCKAYDENGILVSSNVEYK